MATTQTKRKTGQGGSAAGRKTTARKGPAGGGAKRKSPSAAQAKPRTGSQARSRVDTGDAHVQMHTAHAELPIPYFTPGDLTANAHVIGSRLPTLPLPPPKRLAFYGGLGALALVGALDWPVAAAIGAAAAVARSKDD